MALDKSAKRWCLDEALKITTAYATAAREKGDFQPHEVLDECYNKLCELREKIEIN